MKNYRQTLSRVMDPVAVADYCYADGLSAFEAGAIEQAIVRFTEATRCYKRHVMSWYMLGVCLKEVGDKAGARRALSEALSFNPEFKPAWEAMEKISGGDASNRAAMDHKLLYWALAAVGVIGFLLPH